MLTSGSPKAFRTLDAITSEDRPLVGEKAFNCARLKQAAFPIPDGIVVLVTATDRELACLPEHVWFDALPAETAFAARSSGVDEDSQGHSFAGIHDTRLHVRRDRLLEAVTACRVSAASEQARSYRTAQRLPVSSIQIAVLVQRMVAAVASGVAFTSNPVTGTDEIVVNSSWGF